MDDRTILRPEMSETVGLSRFLRFKITGSVRADTIDDACRAIAAYADPDNHDHDDHDAPSEPVEAIKFEWEDDTW